jgi:hypothetical protein
VGAPVRYGDSSLPKPLEVILLEDNLEDLLSSIAAHLDAALLAKARAKRLDARPMLLEDRSQLGASGGAARNHAGFDCVSRFVGCIAAMKPCPPLL